MRLWDAKTGELVRTIRAPLGPRWIAFSPNGTRLRSACLDGSSRVWDVETGKEILILSEHNGRVTALAFSPDGRRIFTASLDGTVKVWHAETGEELLTLRGPQNGFWGFWGLAVSSDGRSIAAASDASSVKIWKTTSPVGD